jgi:hypothetical protein
VVDESPDGEEGGDSGRPQEPLEARFDILGDCGTALAMYVWGPPARETLCRGALKQEYWKQGAAASICLNA